MGQMERRPGRRRTPHHSRIPRRLPAAPRALPHALSTAAAAAAAAGGAITGRRGGAAVLDICGGDADNGPAVPAAGGGGCRRGGNGEGLPSAARAESVAGWSGGGWCSGAQIALITVSTAMMMVGRATAIRAMTRIHSRILEVFLLLRFMGRVYAKKHKI